MLRENDVVDHLIKSLEVDGYIIKQALYDKQRGIDVIAEKQGSVLYIEVKGATSGDQKSRRYGKPFHSGQVFDMLSKVIFKALDNTNISDYNIKKDRTCIALPRADLFQKYHTKVSRYLIKLGIVTFWVSENGSVTIEGNL
tara:strand:- start:615 stop:1037 length:423 start_codon:yes stop_codon:yes gene_type:complete